MSWRILEGDALAMLRTLPDGSAQMCVTSPPYWGLRDYGVAGQLGLERTPDEYVARLVEVFAEVRRMLRGDGTLWLNLGDSYASAWACKRRNIIGNGSPDEGVKRGWIGSGLKEKDLIGIPWRVAFALQADGWWLRSDIIWSKPNPMPESVTDRPTKAHEYLFLLAKAARYYYDAAAIAEPVTQSTVDRLAQPTLGQQKGSSRVPGKTNGNMKAVAPRFGGHKYGDSDEEQYRTKSGNEYHLTERRNARSVWTIATQPFAEAHFATFPPELAERCIKAGSRPGDTVLDPFAGAGTTLLVADRLGRDALGIELNPTYCEIARRRIVADAPLFNGEVTA